MNAPSPGAVLVTGAGRRIGRAIALELGRAGHAIAVHYHGAAGDAEDTVAALKDGGVEAAAFAADLADAEAPARLIAESAAALGPLTGLVNNASVFLDDEIATLDPETWAAHLDVNLRAPVLLAQGFAGQLPAGREGVIINIIDQRVWKLTPRYFSYTISKSGLWTATRTLAQALSPDIRVNAIGPGPTLANDRQSEADFAAQGAATPLGRTVDPEEIAAAARFIFQTRSLTGQMLALDSGQHLAWQTPDVTAAPE